MCLIHVDTHRPGSLTTADAACLWLELDGVDLRLVPQRMRLQRADERNGSALMFGRVGQGRIRIGAMTDLQEQNDSSTWVCTTTGAFCSVAWKGK